MSSAENVGPFAFDQSYCYGVEIQELQFGYPPGEGGVPGGVEGTGEILPESFILRRNPLYFVFSKNFHTHCAAVTRSSGPPSGVPYVATAVLFSNNTFWAIEYDPLVKGGTEYWQPLGLGFNLKQRMWEISRALTQTVYDVQPHCPKLCSLGCSCQYPTSPIELELPQAAHWASKHCEQPHYPSPTCSSPTPPSSPERELNLEQPDCSDPTCPDHGRPTPPPLEAQWYWALLSETEHDPRRVPTVSEERGSRHLCGKTALYGKAALVWALWTFYFAPEEVESQLFRDDRSREHAALDERRGRIPERTILVRIYPTTALKKPFPGDTLLLPA